MVENVEDPKEDSSLDILGKLPKNAPAWSSGIVSVVIASAFAFYIFYSTSRSEIQQYVTGQIDSTKNALEFNKSFINSVFQLTQTQATQIADLIKGLGEAKSENLKLVDRVNTIQLDIEKAKNSLTECEEKLKVCKK